MTRCYLWIFFTPFFLMTSCGYHAGPEEVLSSYQTICIPYVKNDAKGQLTANLIKLVSTQTGLQYQNWGGDLTLLVDLLPIENENVGYHYERKNSGKLRHSIIPTETRLIAIAQVTLVDNMKGKSLWGPAKVMASIEFDHEYEKTRDGINVFSLGQLTNYDEAYEAAHSPLYDQLSQKIIDFIINSE
ncbi:hypothetical protein DB41_EF00020 [Neochlamydia sp. TUME1]|uniref:LPS assembly lipoprotein LptE n=1 Tax=Neochlamydia sp. TUME1 TaxID=1478174 RepID=UPI00057F2654|nr:LPS assembly lipoprotein LptE [Neochlamydia sp. TUME1]KIC76846.1 hypothetical protein DB41_EF00020 [Neochlamydia sp. TUME1]